MDNSELLDSEPVHKEIAVNLQKTTMEDTSITDHGNPKYRIRRSEKSMKSADAAVSLRKHMEMNEFVPMKMVESKEGKKNRYEEETRALTEMDGRYSEKDRVDFMEKSDSINQEVIRKRNELRMAEERSMSPKKIMEIKIEILQLESSARKKLIQGKSIDEKAEEYELGIEDMRLQNRIQEICAGSLTGEQLDKANAKIENNKVKIRNVLHGNPHFVELRSRQIGRALSTLQDVSVEALKQRTLELYDRDDTELLTENDFLSEMENLLQNETSRKIDGMLQDIARYKEELGGKPNYPDGEPRIAREEVIVGEGYAIENRRAWARKLIMRGNIFQRGYGHILDMMYGTEHESTTYERASLYLDGMRKLALFKPYIQQAFENDKTMQIRDIRTLPASSRSDSSNLYAIYNRYNTGAVMLQSLTRMSCHNDLNGAGIESDHCDEILLILTQQYQLAKEEDRLLDFFKNLEGACFDDILRMLQTYADVHRVVLQDEPVLPEPGDGSLYILKQSEIDAMDLNDGDTIINAAGKIVLALEKSNGLNKDITDENEKLYYNWSQVEPELRRHMMNRSFENTDEQGNPTGQKCVVDDNVMEVIKNVLIIITMSVNEI
ncbi:MAG: hypothetical protein PHE02_14440 [Lachnospiraceae bacterium]|nr:hypothetical protein [Lachnospiraceae bacterium]